MESIKGASALAVEHGGRKLLEGNFLAGKNHP